MPFKLGPLEIGLILVIILVVFGVGKLPQVGAAIGKSIRAFKEGQTGEDEEEAKGKKVTKKKKKVVKKPATTEEKPTAPETMGTPGNN
jgi:sec-independent protein translocase protein TatA